MADLQVKGMDHIYQRTGLGVPLVAHRVVPLDSNTPEVQDVQDEFLPRDLRTGATAVMKPSGSLIGGHWHEGPATLTLIDSFGHKYEPIGDRNDRAGVSTARRRWRRSWPAGGWPCWNGRVCSTRDSTSKGWTRPST